MPCTAPAATNDLERAAEELSALARELSPTTFWSIHDPTTRNRQGWDIGSQYRSAVFFHDDEQERLAFASRDEHQGSLTRPIVTEVVPAKASCRGGTS